MKESVMEIFQRIRGYLVKANKESLKMSMHNVHAQGLFSLVIHNTEPGNLIRVFVAKNQIAPYDIQLHSHRYPIRLTPIKGMIIQLEAKPSINAEDSKISMYKYRNFLHENPGLTYLGDHNFSLSDYFIPVGSSLSMKVNDIHTISCQDYAMWIVEEMGFESDSSIVLGVPFDTKDLYDKATEFEIENMRKIVLDEVDSLLKKYKLSK